MTEYGPRPQRISLQCNYLRSFPGVLKVIQFVCDLVALILGLAAPSDKYIGHKGYFTFVAALAIIITLLFLIFALINLQRVCCQVYWLKIEMWWCVAITLLYVIAGIVVATLAKEITLYGAAAFFAFAASLAYIVDGVNRLRQDCAGPPGRRAAAEATAAANQRNEPTY